MSIEVVPLDTSTPEGAARTIEGIHATQRKLAEQGENLAQNLTAKVDDLTASMRTIREAQADAARRAMEASYGSDAGLSEYIERDADSDSVKRYGVMAASETERIRSADIRPHLAGGGSAVRLTGVETDDGYLPGLLDDATPRSEWQAELQRLVSMRSLVRGWTGGKRTPILDRKVMRHIRRAPAPLARIFADVSGQGAEWIIDTASPMLDRELVLARRVEGIFKTFGIPKGGTYISPFLNHSLRPYKAAAAAALDPAVFTRSKISTAQRTATAVKHAVAMQLDRDAAEDSIIDGFQIGLEQLVSALTDGSEDCIINGDTASTHQDAIATWDPRSRWTQGDYTSADHRTMWTGLRARAFDVSATADGSAAETYAGLMAQLASMDSPHAFGSVYAIASPEYYLVKMLQFAEVLTVDKFGDAATIKTGVLARLGPAQVLISEFMTSDLASTGLYTGSGSKTSVLTVNADRFKMGIRRGVRVEQETDVTRDVVNYVATERKVFHTFDASTKKNVALRYNMSSS